MIPERNAARNPLYRRRRVRVTFDKVGGGRLDFALTEVISVDETTEASVATMNGVVRSIIQPWYYGPMRIDVSGRSYFGAYGGIGLGSVSLDIVNVGIDNDVRHLIELRDEINRAFETTGKTTAGGGLFFGDPEDQNNLGTTHDYEGVFGPISFNEADSAPFMRSYKFSFVGQLRSKATVGRGAQAARDDEVAVERVRTSSVGDPLSLSTQKKIVATPPAQTIATANNPQYTIGYNNRGSISQNTLSSSNLTEVQAVPGSTDSRLFFEKGPGGKLAMSKKPIL